MQLQVLYQGRWYWRVHIQQSLWVRLLHAAHRVPGASEELWAAKGA